MKDPQTCIEMLAAWDAGESIWSIEMGGLGPGYEQGIQMLMVEIVRDNISKTAGELSVMTDAFEMARPTIARAFPDEGFSGAMVGAAANLAHRFLFRGYGATIAKARKEVDDRMIQVSSYWPRMKAGAR